MDVVAAPAGAVRLIIHNDGNTPVEYIRGLLHHVFGRSEREANALTVEIEQYGRLACGPYPAPVAKAILQSAQQLNRTSGNSLLITSEAAMASDGCDLCGESQRTTMFLVDGKAAHLCSD